MGRPQPTALKIVKGNPGKRPLNKVEPKPQRGVPPCPDWFVTGGHSREMWERLAPDLDSMGVLTLTDSSALEMLCRAYAEFRAAEALVAAEGLTFNSGDMIKRNPAVAIRTDAWRKVMHGLAEFGLTPSSRSKVQMLPKSSENPFQEFL